jgi:hypothetical protein
LRAFDEKRKIWFNMLSLPAAEFGFSTGIKPSPEMAFL